MLLLLSSTGAAYAVSAPGADDVKVTQQSGACTGVVKDAAGEPIIGAAVVVKGTTNGVVTDFDGNFSLSNVKKGDIIQISFVGYQTVEMAWNGQALNITMQDDTQALDELVVVGYGVMRKSDVTGSISVAKGEDLIKGQEFSALDALRGKAAGVNIFSNSSQPGAQASRVIIRGQSTINASSDPLYVVDGVVMEDFYLVNPNDIESMEVLKDASATAIYGARGANGVIMVTTKRGKKGGDGTTISYQGSVSVASAARKMDTMNAQEWVDAYKIGIQNANKWYDAGLSENWANDYFYDRRFFDSNGNPIYDTNWQDESTRTAVSHNHQLNIQQAGGNSSMGAFLNYTDQQGIVNNTYSKRISGKLAYDAKPTKWLSTSVNLMVNHTWGRYSPETGGGQEARRTMIEMVPWLPVKYDDQYTTAATPDFGGLEGMSNPVMILDLQKRRNYNTKIFGNAALTFHLAEGLDLKTQFGIDHTNREYRGYSSITLNNISMPNGWADYSHYGTTYWQEETYLTYNKTFNDDHRLNAMLGLSWQERVYQRNRAYTEGFSDDFFEDYNMGAGTNPSSPESEWTRWAMNSYFLRLMYNYKDRYSVTATGRYDGSSKFGESNKYAFFPSVGLAWNVSRESWLIDNQTISNLKVHGSYGLTGNSEIGVYRSLGRIGSGTHLMDDTRNPYAYMSSLANQDLKWEKTATIDFGVELGLWQNRLTFDVSYYNKKTTDLLLDCPVPHSTGFTSIYKNIGSVRNQGFDIMISGRPFETDDFNWTSTISANYNKNEILALGDTNADIEQIGFVSGANAILRVGESMGAFYGYKRLGVWTEEDYKNGLCEQKKIGRAKREAKKSILGKGTPDWTGSWINNFRYKNFDLTVDMQFVLGVETTQQFYHSTYDRFGMTNGLDNILYDAYNGTNPTTMQQAIFIAPKSGQDSMNDSAWVVDGSYLRMNMLQLGYTFDSKVIEPLGLSALRLYASANNLFLICSDDFEGFDPEATSQGTNQFGQNLAFFSYPRARTFTFGVNVTF